MNVWKSCKPLRPYIYQSNLKLLLNSIVKETCQSWQAFCVVERLVSR